jgi:hypothetical protein
VIALFVSRRRKVAGWSAGAMRVIIDFLRVEQGMDSEKWQFRA